MNLPSSAVNRSPEKQNPEQEQQSAPVRHSVEDLRSNSDPTLSSSGHDISDTFPYLNKQESNPLTSFSYPLSNTQRAKYSQHTSFTHWDPLSPQTSQLPTGYQVSQAASSIGFPPFTSFQSSTASSLSISPSGLLPPSSSSLNITERVNTSISSIMPNPVNPMNAGTLRMASSATGNKQVFTQVTEVCENLLQLVNVCKDGVVTETHYFKMYEAVKSLNLLMSFISPSFSTNISSPNTPRSNSPSSLTNLQTLATASIGSECNNNSPIQLPPVSQIANLQSIWPSTQKPPTAPTQYSKIDSQSNNNNSNTGQGTNTASPETQSPRSVSPTEDQRFNPYKKIINRNRRIRKGKSVQIKDEERMCAWCSCTQTPEWRNGPNNSMLCNACGLQYRNLMKQEREEKEKNAIGKILNPSSQGPT
mmetsp:Transcript_24313/g.34102  ORF Transcript_24313/g.34102 Transcript_24313/m.34102 type:complete len:419 (-) Transcript_24313:54-1310(-)